MSNFINPFTDWGFKRLFGQEFSKDLLIDFLNDLFVDELHIKDVTFKDKEQLPETKDLRGCVFDIYCETDTGEYFIVEMQNNYVPLFVNRTLYYASKAIEAQREKGKTRQFPTLYDLVPVYVVCFMNFIPREGEEDEIKKFKTDVMLCDKESGEVFTDKLRFVYLRIPLFDKKTEEECVTNFDKWIYVLKHMEALTRMPFMAQKKIFKRLAELADSRSLSKEEQEKYDESRKVVDDYYSGLVGSFMAGEKTGMEKGIKKGIEKNKIDSAKRLLGMGLTPEQVAQGMDLPLAEVLKLSQDK